TEVNRPFLPAPALLPHRYVTPSSCPIWREFHRSSSSGRDHAASDRAYNIQPSRECRGNQSAPPLCSHGLSQRYLRSTPKCPISRDRSRVRRSFQVIESQRPDPNLETPD